MLRIADPRRLAGAARLVHVKHEDARGAAFARIAIVNRGEAATRCLRTIRTLAARDGSDLRAIALYTAADRDAPFVRQADEAIRLPDRAPAVRAYLDHDLLLRALHDARADAVWPGWGFVAEDPSFAERARAEGFVFLGPAHEAMRLLGDKIAAKRLAEEVAVPVAPWSGGAVDGERAACRHAARLGFPLMIKAAAGGGGRGIRRVHARDQVAAAFRAARAEAAAAFGDPRLFLERCVVAARHVEVQIVGDLHGNVLALGCRDCSLQRHHQKVVEEAPPPGLAAEREEALRAAAIRIARAAGYSGVGTVEFLVTGSDAFFLEMNPRLQVEHGITEALTGLDLVELQIRVARGDDLGDLAISERGVAIEARLCAEDPERGFAPTPGRVLRFAPALGPGIRVDTGVTEGATVAPDFDSLLAKVIAVGATREEARARLVAALADAEIVLSGGATNASYLLSLLRSDDFARGGLDTGWLERAAPGADPGAATTPAAALVAAALLLHTRQRAQARARLFASGAFPQLARPLAGTGRVCLTLAGATHELDVCAVDHDRYRVALDGRTVVAGWTRRDAHAARLQVAGRTHRVLAALADGALHVTLDARTHRFALGSGGELRAELPALLRALLVAPGDVVAAGDPVAVTEAMKAETTLRAPVRGRVTQVAAQAGQRLQAGDLILAIAADAASPAADEPRVVLPTCAGEALDDAGDPRRLLRRLLLGFAVAAPVAAALRERLASLPHRPASAAVEAALAAEVVVFADHAALFCRRQRRSADGRPVASTYEQLRRWIAGFRAGRPPGADLAPPLRRALAHHGVTSLDETEHVEEAVLRILQGSGERALQGRIVRALLDRLTRLRATHALLRRTPDLAAALCALADLRALVGAPLADAALELHHLVFAGSQRARRPAAPTADRRWLAPHTAPQPGFVLTRVPCAAAVHCYLARATERPDDVRVVVLARLHARRPRAGRLTDALRTELRHTLHDATRALRRVLDAHDPGARLAANRIVVDVQPALPLDPDTVAALATVVAPATRRLGVESVALAVPAHPGGARGRRAQRTLLVVRERAGIAVTVERRDGVHAQELAPSPDDARRAAARRRGHADPYEIARALGGTFVELELAGDTDPPALRPVDRPPGGNPSSVVVGLLRTATRKVPEGLERVLILSDPGRAMGALAAAECDRIAAALDLAAERGLPVEWVPTSSGARIALDSGTENLDATARVVRRIVRFTRAGGTIHVVVGAVNVGAQSYWNALATMLLHSRGALVMTGDGAMVLTGRSALEAAGAVAAEDEVALGGFERSAGANGEAQYHAADLREAFAILRRHYDYTYVVPGERAPRRHATRDPAARDVTRHRYEGDPGDGFTTVGEIFDEAHNPGRRRPFAIRAVLSAVVDQDGGHLERWAAWQGAETTVVWDAHLGGIPVCLVGIEAKGIARDDAPADGPAEWTGATLHPQSSRKIARALNAASGNRPVVVLANLAGFDGSPESLRSRQLEHGAEIAQAVVEFAGPIVFLVLSRYHGGTYVVFSRALNPRLRVAALHGSYASVIGGAAAARVVFAREAERRALADPAVRSAAASGALAGAAQVRHDAALAAAVAHAEAEIAAEFDAIHTVARAQRVGSIDDLVAPAETRPYLIAALEQALRDG